MVVICQGFAESELVLTLIDKNRQQVNPVYKDYSYSLTVK